MLPGLSRKANRLGVVIFRLPGIMEMRPRATGKARTGKSNGVTTERGDREGRRVCAGPLCVFAARRSHRTGVRLSRRRPVFRELAGKTPERPGEVARVARRSRDARPGEASARPGVLGRTRRDSDRRRFRRSDGLQDPRRSADRRASRTLAAQRPGRRALQEGRPALSDLARRRACSCARKPAVVLVVGVNGSGKTTTIGKLAALLSRGGKRVMFVAADTFRAAAAEQLTIWAERAGAELVRGKEGADPSSVIYDGLAAAKARKVDVVLIDTAGRLQTKTNLMEELKKMRRIIERESRRSARRDAVGRRRHHGSERDLAGQALQRGDRPDGRDRHEARLDRRRAACWSRSSTRSRSRSNSSGIGEKVEELRPFDPGRIRRCALRAGSPRVTDVWHTAALR